MDKELRQVFEEYLDYRTREAGAITLGQQIEMVRTLRREAREQGLLPIGPGQVAQVDVRDPAVRSLLEGRAVSLGGETAASAKKLGSRPAGLSTPVKLAIVGAAALLPIVFVVLLMAFMGKGKARAQVTPTPEVTATPVPTFTSTPTQVITGTATPWPTATPTPYNVALFLAEGAGRGGNDPASVEISGYSFVLGQGEARDGVWNPQGSEWLKGSEVRRVMAVPYAHDVAAAFQGLAPGEPIKVRLRSGEVVEYRTVAVERVKRHEIEVMTDKRPGLTLILYGERAGERWVLLGEAVQRPDDFAIYSPPVITATVPAGTPTPLPPGLTQVVVVEDSLVVTNTVAGLRLEIERCSRLLQVGQAPPPREGWQYVSCQVTLGALRDGARYSGATLAATEYDWITQTEGWWPQPVDAPERIGEGQLSAGSTVEGKVVGIVNRKSTIGVGGKKTRPVVVWEQDGFRYVVDVWEALAG